MENGIINAEYKGIRYTVSEQLIIDAKEFNDIDIISEIMNAINRYHSESDVTILIDNGVATGHITRKNKGEI